MRELVELGYAVVEHRRKEFDWIIFFEVCRLICQMRISRGVRFVKAVVCELDKHIVYLVSRFLWYSVLDATGDFIAAVYEHGAFFIHRRLFLFAHHAADIVRAAHGIARKLANDLHDLFLINNDAVSNVEYRFELFVYVFYLVRCAAVADIVGYIVHRTGTVQRYTRYYFFEVGRLQLAHKALHATRFELEHRFGIAAADQLVHRFIVITELEEVESFARRLLYVVERLFDICQRSQSEEVHFQKTELLINYHVVLRYDDVLVGARERHVVVYRVAAYDDARGVHAYLPRHTLYLLRHVEYAPRRSVACVQIDKLRHARDVGIVPDKLSDMHFFRAARDHLGYLVDLGEFHIEHAPDVFYRRFGRHRAESRYLRNVGLAVLAHDVIDNFAAPVDAKIDVEVGVTDALGIEETLEYQVVFERVDLGYAYRISYYTARAAAAPRSYGYALRFRIVDKVPDNEIVVDELHALDDGQLVLGALAYLVGYLAVTLFQSVLGQLAQVLFARHAVRRDIGRQKLVARYKIRIDLVRYFERRCERVLAIGQSLRHLVVRFEIKLTGREILAVRVRIVERRGSIAELERRMERDSHEHLLHIRVFLAEVVRVVGRDGLYSVVGGELYQLGQNVLLIGYIVILYLYVKVLAEHFLKAFYPSIGGRLVVVQQRLRYNARQTRGKADKPLAVRFYALEVDARLVVQSVDEAFRNYLDEVGVARAVFCEQYQVVELGRRAVLALFAQAHIVCHIHFATDYRLDLERSALFDKVVKIRRRVGILDCGFQKFYRGEHIAVVGHCDRGNPEAVAHAEHFIGADRAVEQRIFGMYVQMRKRFHFFSFTFNVGLAYPRRARLSLLSYRTGV